MHDLRKCPVVVGSPQTQTQRDQVTRVIRRLMTQTHFHRRTLSDLFNHTGAARLSMMTEHSPRSEVASYRDSPNSPATLALSPFSPCGEATSPYVGKPDDSIHRVGSVDEDSETEEVVAMGDSCLDDEVFINSNLVEITRGPALKLSGPFPAHEAVVSVTSTVVECNADSYIDSDTRINADISSPTNSDSKIKSPVKASSSAGGLCSSPTSHTKATASATVVSVFTPLSLTQQNHCLSDGGTKAGQVNHTTKLSGHCSAVAKVDCTDVDKSNDNEKSRDLSITGYIGNRLRSPESGLCEGAGPGRTILPTKAAASALISAETVSLNACHSGAVKGQELYPVSLTRNPIAAGSTSLSESESTMEIRSSVEAGIERIQHPVPVPPPASARPSIGTSSSATGVLAGLRNFRMQWAGSSGRNTPVPDNGDICLTPSVTGTEWDDGAPHNISAYKQLDSDLSSR